MTTHSSQPRDRNEFRIAIICALPLEAGMVRDVFDQVWKYDKTSLGKAQGDNNSYTLGVIGKHNVVLVHMPGMGNIDSATAAGSLRKSFPSIAISFIVGICGANPKNIATNEDIVLGDCIISTSLVQYDFGRRYPEQFSAKSDVEDVIGRAGPMVRAFLAKLQTPQAPQTSQSVENRLAFHLGVLQQWNPKASNPGPHRDRLFDSDYLHAHHETTDECDKCDNDIGICTKECGLLGCQEERIARQASLTSYGDSENERLPRLHFGRYGSANTVLKSGVDRDMLAAKHNIIAFEMEGAGFWENIPTLIIKSACDYADSHKNKEWQGYAAAVAAAGVKSTLEELELSDEAGSNTLLQSPDSSIRKAIRDADAAIRSYHNSSNRLKIERLSREKLPLDKCYINLGLIHRSKQDQYEENKTPFSLETRLQVSAIEDENNLSLGSLFEDRKSSEGKLIIPRRIFIQGRAGIGKTTLCKKIVHEFQNNKLWEGLFDRLLWLPFRSFKSKGAEYGWHDLVRDVYSPQVENWNDLAKSLAEGLLRKEFLSKTLLLFDGLDEINHQWTGDDKMFEFIEGVICDAPNIIITSRPQTSNFDIGQFDLELETIGFTPDQINAYLENCVKDHDIVTRMKALIDQRPLLQGLFRYQSN